MSEIRRGWNDLTPYALEQRQVAASENLVNGTMLCCSREVGNGQPDAAGGIWG